jgi:hypothetical protein
MIEEHLATEAGIDKNSVGHKTLPLRLDYRATTYRTAAGTKH